MLDPESEMNDLYKVPSVPTSFLIDANGKVISHMVGAVGWSLSGAISLLKACFLSGFE